MQGFFSETGYKLKFYSAVYLLINSFQFVQFKTGRRGTLGAVTPKCMNRSRGKGASCSYLLKRREVFNKRCGSKPEGQLYALVISRRNSMEGKSS